jgi:hypothetical protein
MQRSKVMLYSGYGMICIALCVLNMIPMYGQGQSGKKQQDKPIFLDIYFKSGIERENGNGKIKSVAPNIRSILAKYKLNDDAVKIRDEKFSSSDTVMRSRDGRKIKVMDWSKMYRIAMPAIEEAQKISSDLKRNDNVLFVSIRDDNNITPTYDPNDALYQPNIPIWLWSGISGYHPRWYLLDIQAPLAWDIYKGDPNAGIGIMEVDNISSGHPDIQPKILFNSATGPNNTWNGPNVHGTQVAGLAAAVTDNSFGIAGIDHNAKILAGNVFAWHTISSLPNYSNIRIYNHSYATGAYSAPWMYSSYERNLFVHSYNLDNVNVIASANWADRTTWFGTPPNDPIYPGFYQQGRGAIVVGGTDYPGATVHPGSQTGSHLDLVTGSAQIVSSASSTPDFPAPYRWDDYHAAALFGTSFAAPQVAGVASLMIGYAKNIRGMYLTNDDVEGILKVSAVKLNGYTDDAKGWNPNSGHGKLNAYRALNALQNGTLQHRLKLSDLLMADIASESAVFSAYIMGCPNITDGQQNVKRYEVRTTVALPYPGVVWGNGAWMQYGGLAPEDMDSYGNSYVYGMGYCETVPGTYNRVQCQTSDVCVSSTYSQWATNRCVVSVFTRNCVFPL